LAFEVIKNQLDTSKTVANVSIKKFKSQSNLFSQTFSRLSFLVKGKQLVWNENKSLTNKTQTTDN
jgi:hypothetical protein